MNVNANSTSSNGGRGRTRARRRNKNRRNRSRSSASIDNYSNDNYEIDEDYEQERYEFIASFKLNISTASSPILARNDIRKLGNNCYSARMIKKYFKNSNPHDLNIRIVQIWNVSTTDELNLHILHFNPYICQF